MSTQSKKEEELGWKECVAQALKTNDLMDAMQAAKTMDRTFCSSKTTEFKADDRQFLLELIENDNVVSLLRQHAIKALLSNNDTSEETMNVVARCFDSKVPPEIAAEATSYFLSSNEGGIVCAFSKVADTIRSMAKRSEDTALRLVECVLSGLKSAHASAWQNDVAKDILNLLVAMLDSPDIVIVLNCVELLDNDEKWNDDEQQALAQLPVICRIATSTSTFRLVKVGAIRALGGVAARGPRSFDAAIKSGVFEQLHKIISGEEEDQDIVISGMTAVSKALNSSGVLGINAVLSRIPTFFDTLIRTEELPFAGNMMHLMVMHALSHILCSPGRDSSDGSALMRSILFDKLRPDPSTVISDAVKMTCCSSEDRARAGTHFLTSVSFHSWGVDAILADSSFTSTLLVRDYPFFKTKDRFLIAKNIIHFRPEFERTHPDLGLLVSHGPSYIASNPIIKSDAD